jgi:hypothetical protein
MAMAGLAISLSRYFQGVANRHAGRVAAFKPIVAPDVFDEGEVILTALDCAERLLKSRFGERRPGRKLSDAA